MDPKPKLKFNIRSTWAFVIWLVFLVAGFIYTGFKPMAQFWAFGTFLTAGCLGYQTRRLLKCLKKFGGNHEQEGHC